MNSVEEIHVPSLQRSKYFATMALIIAVVSWIGLMVAAHFFLNTNGSSIYLCLVQKQVWLVV